MLGAVSQSGNTPTMYNPIACYDASDTSASNITESVGSLSLIKDRSGNGIDATQVSGSVQPDTNSSTIGGLNAISFASGDYLDMGTIATSGNLTVICAFKPTSNLSGFASFFSGDSTDNDFQIDAGTSASYMGRFNSTNLGVTGTANLVTNQQNTSIVTSYRLSSFAGNIVIRLNGALVDTDTYNGSLATSLIMRIAANRAVNTGIAMKMGEFLIFDEALSDAQMLTIETYLMNKWGI
tara:strand:+ start:28715 stop:29428 length:714 start_codon:yes stop_codon:yes gene_type:complete